MSKPKIDASAMAPTQAPRDTPEVPSTSPRPLPQHLMRGLNAFLWPIAFVVIFHRTWILPKNLAGTDDFTTVWSAVDRFVSRVPVYSENYVTTDPHYLYSPGGTLLLAPIRIFGSLETGRICFAFVQSAAIIVAIILLLRWLGVSRFSPIIPASLALLYLTEPITNTLDFTNVNGSLFLALVLFLIALEQRRNLLAGLIIGIAITIKPVFLPLLFLPFMRRQFSTVLTGIGVVIALNVMAWPLMVQPRDYIDITIPYLGIVRDYANASLTGQLVWLGADSTLILLWRIFFGIFVLASVVLLLRWLERDEKFWLTTTSGILFTGAFFLSSLGQQYYSMMLLPMVLTIIRPLIADTDNEGNVGSTAMLNVGAGLGVVLCFFYASWFVTGPSLLYPWFTIAIGGIGWAILILSITAELIRMTIVDSVNGRSFASGFAWLGDWKIAGKKFNRQSAQEFEEVSHNG
ncbi:glycosyltransferase family 87 protein [uncultured Corynebacterium sp.]|uniref:glycosyltransferase family 87 protein n=1 Tax=uncultured Corynebacterium sp. TaxID=159447 RepID=UPI00260975F8|nr:glycosyltransferase family 87 protein [uncultured Corynebacterium sp.]